MRNGFSGLCVVASLQERFKELKYLFLLDVVGGVLKQLWPSGTRVGSSYPDTTAGGDGKKRGAAG